MREMRCSQLEPGVISYSAAISACEKAQECGQALGLMRELQCSHLKPNVISYSATISA